MKFITEEYLRDLYRKETFSNYVIEEGQRLTPGAIQYLADKKIKLVDKETENHTNEILEEAVESEGALGVSNSKKKICLKLKSIEAKCLLLSSEIVNADVALAQNISKLGHRIKDLKYIVETDAKYVNISALNFSEDEIYNELDDFEITDFHMQLENSDAILKMNILHCSLVEMKFDIIEAYDYQEEDLKNIVISRLNHVIESLSKLIKLAVGGRECQIIV
jgi:ethanolamine utilization cobalamin adenosyltransferase